MRALPIFAVLALVGSSPASVAQNHKGQAVTPEKIQWGPAPSVLPKGAEMAGQGADLLETRAWGGLSERVIVASYSASRSFRTAAI
jgi:hypothetical protein